MAETAVIPRVVYAGTSAGTTGAFALSTEGTAWTFDSTSEIVVKRFESETATTSTTLVENTDYTISGTSGSASLTLTTALTENQRLVIQRFTVLSSDIDLASSSRLGASTITASHDKAARQLQDLQAQINWLLDAAGTGFAPGVASGTVNVVSTDAAGAAGADGTNGTDGADGLSAYQIWLNLGNTGTEQDFIDSLSAGATLNSGAGYRENADGTYTAWGAVTVGSGTGQAAALLPVIATNIDYSVVATSADVTERVAVRAAQRSTSGFNIAADTTNAIEVNWIAEGITV